MWTPRRILLAAIGLMFFGTTYGVYAYFLGWIDGLPSLPGEYAERAIFNENDMFVLPADGNPTAQRIRQAFGVNAPELHYKIKADSKAKGILVVAQDVTKPDEKGQVEFISCSVAIFGKNRGLKGTQEVTTMHCDRAILQFDKPLQKWTDMEGRKVVSAELIADPDIRYYHPHKGYIRLTNNRRSDNPNDMIEVRTRGPVYYKAEPEKSNPHISTENVLELTDHQNVPLDEPAEQVVGLPTMTAQGMKLFLAQETPKKDPTPHPAGKKDKPTNTASVTGVERIELISNVTMNLWVDPSSSFMASTQPPKSESQPKAPLAKGDQKPEGKKKAEKSLIQVRTYGPFFYDMPSDKARFEKATKVDPSIPNYVQVTRQIRGSTNRDMMTSDYLEIQFRRKKSTAKTQTPPPVATPLADPNSKPEKAKSPESEIDIETIHAWGTTVVLSSDSEDINAYGNDLIHDNIRKETILKGDQVIVVKDGNQINAKELILVGLDDRAKQQARVKGPGQIDIGQVDPKTKEFVFTRQAQWQEWLVFSRVKEQGRDLDLLTLTGGAKFADKQNDQFITARQLKVWILPSDKTKELAKSKELPKAKEPIQKEKDDKLTARPHRLEGVGDVVAHGPELDVRNTDYLNVWFKEAPPVPTPATTPAPMITKQPIILNPMNPVPKIGTNPTNILVAKVEPKTEKKPKPPIKVSARRIETWVLLRGNKVDLDRVHCEERVVVHQDGTMDAPTGVDIAGNAVDLEHYTDGNIVVVTGTKQQYGEVRFDKLDMKGEEVTINQRTNSANVKGPGTIRLDSSTNLRGEKLDIAKPLVIHWEEGMEFRGADQSIVFDGKVQAVQDDAKVLCESMQVLLDRVVYINHLQKPKEEKKVDATGAKKEDTRPKVDRVICDQQPKNPQSGMKLTPVTMIEETYQNGKLIKYQYLEAKEFDLDNLRRKLGAPGPGIVRLFQLAPKDSFGEPNPNAKAELETKLTVVEYSRQMQAQTNTNPQWAKFFGPVEAFHLPADKPDMEFNPTKLPERAVRLKCNEELVVTMRKELENGKMLTYQTLEASGNVQVWTDDFRAEASKVKYDQKRDTITFEGDRGLPAVIRQKVGVGVAPKNFEAGKFIYNRKTRELKTEDGRSLSD